MNRVHQKAFLGALAMDSLRRSTSAPAPLAGKLRERSDLLCGLAGDDWKTALLKAGGYIVREPEFAPALAEITGEFAAATMPTGKTEPLGEYRVRIQGELVDLPPGFCQSVAAAKSVRLILNCSGGDVNVAWKMIDALEGKPVVAEIQRAGSAGALLAMAANRRTIAKDGSLMLHPPHQIVMGGVNELRRIADEFEAATWDLVAYFSERTGQPVETVAQWFDGNDHFFDASTALKHGLVTSIAP